MPLVVEIEVKVEIVCLADEEVLKSHGYLMNDGSNVDDEVASQDKCRGCSCVCPHIYVSAPLKLQLTRRLFGKYYLAPNTYLSKYCGQGPTDTLVQ